MVLFRIGFISFTLIDLLDIAAVYFVFFKIYQIMKGTRASQMFAGLLLIIVSSFIFQMLNMEGMSRLVSSGLGGRFPVGYPVAVVTAVERDPGQPFARITAQPRAALDRSRHVLLVFTDNRPQQGD